MNDIQTGHVKEKEPGWGERLGFGAGSFAHSLISAVFAAYGTIYLTNVALLDVAVISMMIGFSKLFDVISDAIIGHLIDTRTTRLGKARGWMLRMCIPFAISSILLFTVPARFSLPAKYIYVFFMFNLASTVFVSFLQISHYSLVSLISGDRAEQGLLGNILALFRTAAVFIGNSMFVKLLLVFTSEPGNQNTQRAYTECQRPTRLDRGPGILFWDSVCLWQDLMQP